MCNANATRENVLENYKIASAIFSLLLLMIDTFPEHYYIAESYGLEREFLDTYRYFRKQGVTRAFAAYYAAKEWDL